MVDGRTLTVAAASVGRCAGVEALVVDAMFIRCAVGVVDTLERVAFHFRLAGCLERTMTYWAVVLG